MSSNIYKDCVDISTNSLKDAFILRLYEKNYSINNFLQGRRYTKKKIPKTFCQLFERDMKTAAAEICDLSGGTYSELEKVNNLIAKFQKFIDRDLIETERKGNEFDLLLFFSKQLMKVPYVTLREPLLVYRQDSKRYFSEYEILEYFLSTKQFIPERGITVEIFGDKVSFLYLQPGTQIICPLSHLSGELSFQEIIIRPVSKMEYIGDFIYNKKAYPLWSMSRYRNTSPSFPRQSRSYNIPKSKSPKTRKTISSARFSFS